MPVVTGERALMMIDDTIRGWCPSLVHLSPFAIYVPYLIKFSSFNYVLMSFRPFFN
jgi:hypothetical protein